MTLFLEGLLGVATSGEGDVTGVAVTACVIFTFTIGVENSKPNADNFTNRSSCETTVVATRDEPSEETTATLALIGACVNP